MDNITQLIKENLLKLSEKTLILTEKVKVSKELQYHIDENLTLTNNVFLAYSKKYFNLINEVRDLWVRGLIKLNEEDELMVMSDTGKTAIFEGKKVYLDAPLIENLVTIDNFLSNRKVYQFILEGWEDEMSKLRSYGMKVVETHSSGPYNMLLIAGMGMFQVALTTNEEEFTTFDAQISKPPKQISNFRKIAIELVTVVEGWLSKYGELFVGSYNKERTNKYHRIFTSMGLDIEPIKARDFGNGITSYFFMINPSDRNINEAEHRGKKVNIGKPFRTPGGPKKFAVYVKTPSGGVKKVTFGDPNLKVRNKNKGAAKSFRARHKCDQKKDRTTAGYWSCNVGRYSKQLGLKSSNSW